MADSEGVAEAGNPLGASGAWASKTSRVDATGPGDKKAGSVWVVAGPSSELGLPMMGRSMVAAAVGISVAICVAADFSVDGWSC